MATGKTLRISMKSENAAKCNVINWKTFSAQVQCTTFNKYSFRSIKNPMISRLSTRAVVGYRLKYQRQSYLNNKNERIDDAVAVKSFRNIRNYNSNGQVSRKISKRQDWAKRKWKTCTLQTADNLRRIWMQCITANIKIVCIKCNIYRIPGGAGHHRKWSF